MVSRNDADAQRRHGFTHGRQGAQRRKVFNLCALIIKLNPNIFSFASLHDPQPVASSRIRCVVA